jgi:hypothetical protein
MPKRASLIKQVELQRALRAMKAEGLLVSRLEVEVATGKVTIVTQTAEGAQTDTPLEQWLAKHARSS